MQEKPLKKKKPASPTEKQIENGILEYLSYLKDCFAWKNQNVGIWDASKKVYRKPKGKFQFKGVADILGVYQGKFLAIEVKRKGGKVSREQRTFLENVIHHGGIAFVAYSVDDVKRELND